MVSAAKLFINKLCAFLDYSNHKQFFLVKAFASITSAPLRKNLAACLATGELPGPQGNCQGKRQGDRGGDRMTGVVMGWQGEATGWQGRSSKVGQNEQQSFTCITLVWLHQFFLRCFMDPFRDRRIENRVSKIRKNYHWVPRIRENRVPTGPYRVFNIFLKKKLVAPQSQNVHKHHKNGLVSSHQSVGRWFIFLCAL